MAAPMTTLKVDRLCLIAEWITVIVMISSFLLFDIMLFGLLTNHADLIGHLDNALLDEINGDNIKSISSNTARIFGFMLWSIMLLIIGFLMYQTRALFLAFRKNHYFSQEVGQRLSLIGWTLFSIFPMDILISMGIEAVLSYYKTATAAGQLSVSIGFEIWDLMIVIFGLLIVIFGRVYVEATHIAEENKSFI